MKYLILLLLISVSAHAVPQQYTPWPPTNKIYVIQSQCPGTCYPIVENGVAKNLAIQQLADVEVDDLTKPIYTTPTNVQACASVSACRELIRDKCLIPGCAPEDMVKYCTPPDHALFKQVDSAYEAYCTHLTGYEKKLVKKLVVDPVKEAAFNQAQSEAATEAAAVQTKFNQRIPLLKACAALDNTATLAQVRACMILLSRHTLWNILKSNEQ